MSLRFKTTSQQNSNCLYGLQKRVYAGFPEFRNRSLVKAAIGNGVISIAYLVSPNPISSVGSHIAMHVAAVIHGPEHTVQLPPHYGTDTNQPASA